ncbi:serine protease [Methyloversatilis thermotolerans]|uniref:serine protease n=1 Tax=Methyloversatilis thermotolerans TaxID=1346290 RepID=UPI00036DBEE4|nr:serine protease [Methyloversatilis thermotolerans]
MKRLQTFKRWAAPLALLACGSAHAAPSAFDIARPSVVTIGAQAEDGESGQGSGVIVGAQQVVTNCHVVRFARTITVRGSDGRDLPVNAVLADMERDLCRLDVPGLAGPAAQRRPASEAPQTGEPVVTVGNPLGLGIATSSGLLSAIVERDGQPVLIVSAPLSPGSSGGGLFDGRGRLIGITTAVMVTGQNTNIAIPVAWIDELPARGKPAPVLPPAPAPEVDWPARAEALRIARDWAGLDALCAEWQQALPEVSHAWRLQALALRNLGQHELAEKRLRQALELNPRNDQALIELYALLDETGRDQDATDMLARVRALVPQRGYADRIEAGHFARLGDMEQAYALALRATTRGSGDPLAWALLAELAERTKRYPEAARAWRVALAQQPGEAAWSAALSRVLLAQGDLRGAQRATEGMDAFSRAGQLITLGNEAYAKGRLADAEDALRKALELDPSATQAAVTLAAILIETGRDGSGRQMLEDVLKRDPEDVEGLRLKARLLTRDRKFSAASGVLDKVLAKRPDDVQTLRALMAVEFADNDLPGAIAYGRRLAAAPGAEVKDKVGVAHLLIRSNELAEAAALLADALRETPDDLDTLLAQIALEAQRGDQDKALAQSIHATTLHPTSGAAWSTRGYTLHRMGRYAEAVSALETAVRLEPDLGNSWINLGNALLHQKQLRRAVEALERAEQLAPDAEDGRFYLAQAYAATGQTDKALQRLDSLIAWNPTLSKALSLKGFVHAQRGDAEKLQQVYVRLKSMHPPSAEQLRMLVIKNMPAMSKAVSEP